jgi:hypothetical protein
VTAEAVLPNFVLVDLLPLCGHHIPGNAYYPVVVVSRIKYFLFYSLPIYSYPYISVFGESELHFEAGESFI